MRHLAALLELETSLLLIWDLEAAKMSDLLYQLMLTFHRVYTIPLPAVFPTLLALCRAAFPSWLLEDEILYDASPLLLQKFCQVGHRHPK